MINAPLVVRYSNGVLNFDALASDSTLIGHIYGGIASSDKNIFWINDGTQSIASTGIYKVNLIQNTTSISEFPEWKEEKRDLIVAYPNPSWGELNIEFFLPEASEVFFSVIDPKGSAMFQDDFNGKLWPAGKNKFAFEIDPDGDYDTVIVNIRTNSFSRSQRVVLY